MLIISIHTILGLENSEDLFSYGSPKATNIELLLADLRSIHEGIKRLNI
jgi:hypothetical protein